MSSKTLGRVAAVALVAAATLAGGLFGSRAFTKKDDALSEVKEAYVSALEVVSENYAGEVDFEKVGESGIQGMLWTLDPHSSYFTRTEYARLMQDQESRFTGIGVSILRHRDGVYVQTPLEGTPAARAGMRFGDRIVEVDGKDAREWSTQQVSRAVRGPEGERVTIKVERAGANAPIYLTIVRASVPQPSVRNAFIARPGIGYVGLTGSFTQTTADELSAAITNLEKQGMRQLVLDLRNNPGGLLDQAIRVASQFVERGKTIVSVRGRDASDSREFKNTYGDPVDFPLVVLINRNSASASEIVAGAVQDHGRGLVVGETSFGKGLVQRVFKLPYQTGLTLTTAKYYTPYGRSIQRDYVSGSFYDYFSRQNPDAAPSPATPLSPTHPSSPTQALPIPTPQPTPAATPNGPPVRTAAGRIYYGGGGITPDHEVKPLDVVSPVRARIFEESFQFVRQLVAGKVAGLENYALTNGPQFGRYPRPNELQITDRVIEAFRAFARADKESGLTSAQVESELDYLKLRLREDLITAAYGGEAGARFLLESDPQLLRALELLPEAKTLAENVRRQK